MLIFTFTGGTFLFWSNLTSVKCHFVILLHFSLVKTFLRDFTSILWWFFYCICCYCFWRTNLTRDGWLSIMTNIKPFFIDVLLYNIFFNLHFLFILKRNKYLLHIIHGLQPIKKCNKKKLPTSPFIKVYQPGLPKKVHLLSFEQIWWCMYLSCTGTCYVVCSIYNLNKNC